MQDVFIRRLVELMEEKDMSQTELANLIGTTNVTVSRYISGDRRPRLEIMEKLAEVFGVSIDYLLGFSNIKNLPSSKIHSNYPAIDDKLNDIAATVNNKHFSKEQILIIEKLLETNRDFISRVGF